jgi:polysaccharide biosynthesis protein PelA
MFIGFKEPSTPPPSAANGRRESAGLISEQHGLGKWLVMIRLFLLFLILSGALPAALGKTFHVRINRDLPGDDWLVHDVTFLNPEAAVDLKLGQSMGHRYYAHLLASDGAGTRAATLAEAERAATRGFDGWLIDPTRGIVPAAEPPSTETWQRVAEWTTLFRALRQKHPSKRIILRTSISPPTALRTLVDGYLMEGIYQTVLTSGNAYAPTPPSTMKEREVMAQTARAEGKEVFGRDYLPSDQAVLAIEIAQRIEALGAAAAVGPAVPAAGLLAPIAEVPRTVLCLYGFGDNDATRPPIWPPDTYAAQTLQTALEYLGYDLEFHDVGAEKLPQRLGRRFAGIIVDSRIELPYVEEANYVRWLTEHKSRGLKILFCGDYMGSQMPVRAELATAFGLRGSLEAITGVPSAEVTTVDKTVVAEKLVFPKTNGLMTARSPEGSQVALALKATDRRGLNLSYDAIYTTSWGGAILTPYLLFETSSEDVRTLVDPFVFLSRIFPAFSGPIPDATTREGLRMLLSHIDGDGFTTLTRMQTNVTCAEIVRDRVLKVYPIPVSVSVIEADVCGLTKELSESDRPRYEEIGRSIFELNTVQGASHAYSHPFVWNPKDVESASSYARPNLEFANPALYPKISVRREIAGSVDYIQKNLMPTGKKVEMFLWSGNCRPSGEALKMVSDLGLEALNGGNTMINRRAEGITAISPRDTFMDGELQIYAPIQNEYVYTNGFTGPFFGGFRDVIDTFQRTETPRRLKPVNIYYHFYSVQPADGFKAIRDIHEWAVSQPLHGVTCAEFARIARDARRTRVYRTGSQQWAVVNSGHCRTLRFPNDAPVPNLARSSGVTGFRQDAEALWVSTTGAPRVLIDQTPLDPATPPVPFLISSSGPLRIVAQAPGKFQAAVADFRPVSIRLGGFPSEADVSIKIDDRPPSTVRVDKDGIFATMLPMRCDFSIN